MYHKITKKCMIISSKEAYAHALQLQTRHPPHLDTSLASGWEDYRTTMMIFPNLSHIVSTTSYQSPICYHDDYLLPPLPHHITSHLAPHASRCPPMNLPSHTPHHDTTIKLHSLCSSIVTVYLVDNTSCSPCVSHGL